MFRSVRTDASIFTAIGAPAPFGSWVIASPVSSAFLETENPFRPKVEESIFYKSMEIV
ncbi:hypothetical protein OUHCRE10_11540 [Enterobacter hormaechei subsp. xiangfangensis]|nr:hypothetical protein SL264_24920 [Enterobacter cloacae]